MKGRLQLLGNALRTGLGNLFVRLSGMFREIVFSAAFGTSAFLSDFLFAFTIPNLFRRVLGEGALANALIPLYSAEKNTSEEEADKFASKIVSLFTVINIGVAALTILCFFIASFIFPQYEFMCRMVMGVTPYLPLICVSGLLASLLNTRGIFAFPAMLGSLLNFFLILASLLHIYFKSSPASGSWMLIYAVLITGIIQTSLLIYKLKKINFALSWNCTWRDPKVKKFFLIALPAIIGASGQQISTALDKVIARGLSDHAVAALSYSERLIYLPVGIFAVALSTACLPQMSKAIAENKPKELDLACDTALKTAFFLSAPCFILILLFGELYLRLLYQRGAFDEESLRVTLHALIFYAPGIPAFALVKVISPVFFSHQDTKLPFKISSFCILINLIISLSTVYWLEHAALALGTSIASWLNFLFLFYFAKKRRYIHSLPTFTSFIIKASLCIAISASLSFYLVKISQGIFNNLSFLHLLSLTSISIASFGISYLILSQFFLKFKIQELLTKRNNK